MSKLHGLINNVAGFVLFSDQFLNVITSIEIGFGNVMIRSSCRVQLSAKI